MGVQADSKFKWKKSVYILEDNKYIRRIGNIKETEVTHINDSNNNLLFDLLDIDIDNPNDILRFCNENGRLGIAHPYCVYEAGYPLEYFHYDIDGEMPHDLPDKLEDTYNYQAPETLRSYRIYVQIIKAISNLDDAIRTKRYKVICKKALFLLSTFEGFTAVPDALFDLDNQILNECRKHVAWPVPIGMDMKKINETGSKDTFDSESWLSGEQKWTAPTGAGIEAIYEPGSRYTFEYEPWLTGELNYEEGFSLDAFINKCSQTELKDMLDFSNRLIARIISKNIRPIRFTLDVTASGELQDSWLADSLSSIIYYMLYMKVSRGQIIRFCANRTCGEAFLVKRNNHLRTYCSERCRNVEAKRRQREKEKEKTAKNTEDNSGCSNAK